MRGNQAEKGTVLVFVALMLPFLILFAGAAIDIGRAYLHKSYMQNAADAAALAGVETVSGEKARLITASTVPVMGQYIESESSVKADAGADKFLAMDTGGKWKTSESNVTTELRKELNLKRNNPILKNRAATYYYKVEMSDEIDFQFASMFLPKALLPTDWKVKVEAWAMANNNPLSGVDLLTQMKELEEAYTYSTFQELQAHFKGKSYDYIKEISFTNKGTAYRSDGTRNEIFNLDGTNAINNNMNSLLVNFKPDFTSAQPFTDNWDLHTLDNMTPAEARSYLWDVMGIKLINWRIIDKDGNFVEGREGGSIYWGQVYDKLKKLFETELKAEFGAALSTAQIAQQAAEKAAQVMFARIASIINVTQSYAVRDVEAIAQNNPDDVSYDVDTDEPNKLDPLFVRIESEEYNTKGEMGYVMNTVRDITINIQAANTEKDGENYKYRPIIFFYEGPVDQNGIMGGERKSQTVTLNLEADFRGILFAPNSPVCINGTDKNGISHKFTGLVIAEKFVDEMGNDIFTADSLTDEAQTTYIQMGLSDAEYDTFGLTKLVVYTDPEKDIIFNTTRASGTI